MCNENSPPVCRAIADSWMGKVYLAYPPEDAGDIIHNRIWAAKSIAAMISQVFVHQLDDGVSASEIEGAFGGISILLSEAGAMVEVEVFGGGK